MKAEITFSHIKQMCSFEIDFPALNTNKKKNWTKSPISPQIFSLLLKQNRKTGQEKGPRRILGWGDTLPRKKSSENLPRVTNMSQIMKPKEHGWQRKKEFGAVQRGIRFAWGAHRLIHWATLGQSMGMVASMQKEQGVLGPTLVYMKWAPCRWVVLREKLKAQLSRP